MSGYDTKTQTYTCASVPAAKIPEQLSVFDLMYQHKKRSPDAPWLIDAATGRTLTQSQALQRSLDIAKALHKFYKVGQDDTVAVFSGNEVDYGPTLWGTFRLGGICSCANPSYGKDELKYQLNHVHDHHPVKVLVIDPDSLPVAAAAVASSKLKGDVIVLIRKPGSNSSDEVKNLAKKYKTLDDLVAGSKEVKLPEYKKLSEKESRTKLAFLSFSSGTTGLPKAVEIPHYSVISNVYQASTWWTAKDALHSYNPKDGSGDIVMGCLPFFHIYGLVVVLHLSLFMDTPVVCLPKFTLPDFLGAIQKHKITMLYVVPPIVVQLVKNPMTEKYDLSSMRFGMAGAAPMTEELGKALKVKFPKLTFGQGYGMTETCTIVSLFDSKAKVQPGSSAGKLVPNITAKIVSPEGKFLGPGEIGELWSRSPSNAIGYLANEKATKDTFDSEGYVHTGDECLIDNDGNLFVVDRIKELIKVKGNQVAPAELEGHLLDHPDVQDVCVIGIPDERAGERPKAYVALTTSAAEQVAKSSSESDKVVKSIKDHVAKHKIAYKHLGEVEFIEAIPKTASGKLLRKDLRVLHAAKTKKSAKL